MLHVSTAVLVKANAAMMRGDRVRVPWRLLRLDDQVVRLALNRAARQVLGKKF